MKNGNAKQKVDYNSYGVSVEGRSLEKGQFGVVLNDHENNAKSLNGRPICFTLCKLHFYCLLRDFGECDPDMFL